MTPRIRPIPFKEWPPEITGAIPAVTRSDAPPQEETQKAKNMLGTLAHHPALAQALLPFNAHVLRATTLSERQRELLVLRVATVRKSAYTWAEHAPMARKAGLDEEEIARIAYGPDAPFWDPLEATILCSVDELIADGALSDQTWATLSEHLDASQLLDLIFTIGAYETMSWMIRSFELDPDDDLLPVKQTTA
jgi:AhpD family alkylhydroperoxidase